MGRTSDWKSGDAPATPEIVSASAAAMDAQPSRFESGAEVEGLIVRQPETCVSATCSGLRDPATHHMRALLEEPTSQ